MTETLVPRRGPANGFALRTTPRMGHVAIAVHGELDHKSSHHLEETIAHLIAPDDKIMIDLSNLDFMDTTGLEALRRSGDHAASVGATLTLEGLPARFRRLLYQCRGASSSHSVSPAGDIDGLPPPSRT